MSSAQNAKAQTAPPSSAQIAGTLLLAWLIPGAGFMAHGRARRGVALFLILNLTFAFGLALHGGVVWPSWDWRNPDSGFNVVNNLTFLLQMGCGLPALASLCAERMGAGGWLAFWVADAAHPLYDLSAFYLLVAGAMNYFVVCNTYDRLFGTRGAPTDESAEKTGTEQK